MLYIQIHFDDGKLNSLLYRAEVSFNRTFVESLDVILKVISLFQLEITQRTNKTIKINNLQ